VKTYFSYFLRLYYYFNRILIDRVWVQKVAFFVPFLAFSQRRKFREKVVMARGVMHRFSVQRVKM
jgi:hypothetical protein